MKVEVIIVEHILDLNLGDIIFKNKINEISYLIETEIPLCGKSELF